MRWDNIGQTTDGTTNKKDTEEWLVALKSPEYRFGNVHSFIGINHHIKMGFVLEVMGCVSQCKGSSMTARNDGTGLKTNFLKKLIRY